MGQAYNEEAFRSLLAIERKRAAPARRSFLLLLVSVRRHPGVGNRIPPRVADRIFSGLRVSVREVDFVGWFHQERVAGAILTQGRQRPTPDASRRIGQRLIHTLSGRVPPDIACRLQVRVLQLRSVHES